MTRQRNISIGSPRGADLLHVEAPGCVVNIRVGLKDSEGRVVTNISIEADGNRYSGDAEWWIDGVADDDHKGRAVRVVCIGRRAP